jgi:hypothetical protein
VTVKLFPAYVFSQAQHAGTVAAHNHMALTNPVGSTKLILLGGVFISQVTVGATSTPDPLRGYLASEVSGGTLQDASAIGKTQSIYDDPVGQIRIEDVTATLGAALFNSPALLATGASAVGLVHQIPTALPGAGNITLRPGESLVLRTEAGDTDQRWNISIAWMEAG